MRRRASVLIGGGIEPELPVADEAKVQSCAETGEMQTVVKQCDIVSNGKEVRN